MKIVDYFSNLFESLVRWLMLFQWGDQGWGDEFLRGFLLTVSLSVVAFAVAIIIGIAGALTAQSNNRFASTVINFYSTLARCLPELIIVFLVYFIFLRLFQAFGLTWFDSGVLGAPIAVALISGAYSIEVFRGALLATPKGEVEAAFAYGMHKEQVRFKIILPHLFRIALPGLGNIWLLLVKDVSLISLVGMRELMGWAKVATDSTPQVFFSFYIMAAIIYLLITAVSERSFLYFHKKTNRSQRVLAQN